MPPISGEVFCSINVFRSGHFVSRVLDRFDDILVPRAATEIARNSPANFLLSGVRISFEKSFSGQNHSGRAEPALETMLLPEAFLERMKLSVVSHTFDRPNLLIICLHGKNRARFYRFPIKKNGTRAAIRRIATDMRSGKS
jgi:hypothetical protein